MGLNFLSNDGAGDEKKPDHITKDDLLSDAHISNEEIQERFGKDTLEHVLKIEGEAQQIVDLFMSIIAKKEANDESVALDLFVVSMRIKGVVAQFNDEEMGALIAHLGTRYAQLVAMVTEEDDGEDDNGDD